MTRLHEVDRGWIDYATTYYWYQETPGYRHRNTLRLEDRAKKVLHPNLSP
ncbi:MAG: hypothetical protein HXS50_03520 [Theionarchaea archaeon]|nr:hypothetical protein [Theionarchaea archaeon]